MLPLPEKPSMITLDVDFAYSVSDHTLTQWTVLCLRECISWGVHGLCEMLPAVFIGHDRSIHAERHGLLLLLEKFLTQLSTDD